MILPSQKDALHRGQIYRLLIAIADDAVLSKNLIFKGGTCAALLQRLDRFSVDLDFDLVSSARAIIVKSSFKKVFSQLGLTIKDESKEVIQFYLKYDSLIGSRNTLKLDVVNMSYKNDISEKVFIADIKRYMICQTVETQFAHKLVAVMDRYEKYGSIAGRDIYDIHHFFMKQYRFSEDIILERTGVKAYEYIQKLTDFIEKHVTQTVINEDINMLLPYEKFSAVRKSLKAELISMLKIINLKPVITGQY